MSRGHQVGRELHPLELQAEQLPRASGPAWSCPRRARRPAARASPSAPPPAGAGAGRARRTGGPRRGRRAVSNSSRASLGSVMSKAYGRRPSSNRHTDADRPEVRASSGREAGIRFTGGADPLSTSRPELRYESMPFDEGVDPPYVQARSPDGPSEAFASATGDCRETVPRCRRVRTLDTPVTSRRSMHGQCLGRSPVGA